MLTENKLSKKNQADKVEKNIILVTVILAIILIWRKFKPKNITKPYVREMESKPKSHK